MSGIYTMGEILVEIMRDQPDSPLDQAGTFKGPYPSGAPAIFISAAARMGQKTRIWGGVGQDGFGSLILNRLNHDGVDCRSVTVKKNRSTAVAFVSYDRRGERNFIFHIDGTPAGEALFVPDNCSSPDFFHIMGCSLMVNDSLYREIIKAMEFFSDRGAKISFDPNIRPELLGNRSLEEITDPIMKRCSVFLPGQEELRLFSSEKELSLCAADLFSRYEKMEIILVKKGSRGAELHTGDSFFEIPPYTLKPEEVIDPTGAGDTFDAVFLAGLLEKRDLKSAAERAARAGALNTMAFGPMEGDLSSLV
jgi:sugar/nucleoside kinase (ribokinase family)